MCQSRGSHRLAAEPLDEVRIVTKVVPQKLDCDAPAEASVGRRVDAAHPAARYRFFESVTALEIGRVGHQPLIFRSASRIWRAIGAATAPPVASEPKVPPCSTSTATAIWGSSAGAKQMNQVWGFWPWIPV